MSIVQIIVIAVICLVAAAPGGIVLPRRPRGTGCRCSTWRRSPGAFALLGQTWAQAHLAATRCAIIMSMEPVFAALFAVLFGGETPTVRMLVGGAMVLAAMLIVELHAAAQGRGRGPAHRGLIQIRSTRGQGSGSPAFTVRSIVPPPRGPPWSSSCRRTPPTRTSRTSSNAVESVGGEAFVSKGVVRTIIGLVGDIDSFHHLNLRTLPGVADVHRISDPYKLVSRQHHPERSTVWVGRAGHQVPIGPGHVHLHRRPVRRREPPSRPSRRRGWRSRPAPRSCAAARSSRARRRTPSRASARRAGDPRRRPRGHRAADRHRGRRRPRRAGGRRVRRHAAGRHPQHGQLRAAPGRRRGRQAGPPQARHDRDRSRSG